MEGPDPAPGGRRQRARMWLFRPHFLAGGEHSEGHYAARSVYGAILVLALLLALQDHPPGPFRAALLVAGTVLAVVAAEAYADLLGFEIDLGRPPTREERRDKARELAVVLAAGEGPVLVFLLAGFGLIEEDTAFRVAVAVTLVLLFLAGFMARRLAGRSVGAALRSAFAAGGIGVALAIFKSLAHG